jgi:hypothetical protein
MLHITLAELTTYLQGIDFPLSKEGIMVGARENDIDELVLTELDALPEREYMDIADISIALGVLHEQDHFDEDDLEVGIDDDELIVDELVADDKMF